MVIENIAGIESNANIMKHFIPFTNELHEEKFFVKINGVLHATPLLLILVLIESSDIIFALDSIPAIFLNHYKIRKNQKYIKASEIY